MTQKEKTIVYNALLNYARDLRRDAEYFREPPKPNDRLAYDYICDAEMAERVAYRDFEQ